MTDRLQLELYDPTDPARPYPKQAHFLLGIDRAEPGTTRSHWVAGRGSAKTTTGLVLAKMAAFIWMPGMAGCWTEPTVSACRDIFLAEWCRVIPRELYQVRTSPTIEILCVNGSVIHVRSRNVDNRQREVLKGVNLAWAIEDEAAYKFDERKYWDLDNAIRVDTPYRFHDTLSTPKLDTGYYELCHSSGHNLVHASSFDNPYLPEGWAEEQAEQLGGQYLRQEIYGEWVPLSGLLWPEWKEERWPQGNIHPHVHDHSAPYLLAFDIGVATSAWSVLQRIPTNKGHIWVVTAEYTPKRDGSIDTILRRIKQDYGTPAKVVVGADINTRESGSGQDHMFYVRNHFGIIPVTPVTGWIASKEVQHSQLTFMICNSRNIRRLCRSAKMKNHTPETKPPRGITEVMKMDHWPDDSERRRVGLATALSDGTREHMRDALLYFAVAVGAPPSYRLNRGK